MVDDDADVRFLLRVVLDRAGETAVVAEATNGEEAIAAARMHQPDVIVLDEAMPVMRGTEAIPALRVVAPDARIVMYTAHAETELRARMAALADAVCVKGAPMSGLLELVAT